MKRLIILISLMVLFFSISVVSAGLFGPNTIECDKFILEYPEGFSETELEGNNDTVHLGTGIPEKGEIHRYLTMQDVLSFEELEDNIEIVENYTNDNLKVLKCHNINERGHVSENFTHSEFEKEGHFFVVEIQYDGDLNTLNLDDEIDLIKSIKEKTKVK